MYHIEGTINDKEINKIYESTLKGYIAFMDDLTSFMAQPNIHIVGYMDEDGYYNYNQYAYDIVYWNEIDDHNASIINPRDFRRNNPEWYNSEFWKQYDEQYKPAFFESEAAYKEGIKIMDKVMKSLV